MSDPAIWAAVSVALAGGIALGLAQSVVAYLAGVGYARTKDIREMDAMHDAIVERDREINELTAELVRLRGQKGPTA